MWRRIIVGRVYIGFRERGLSWTGEKLPTFQHYSFGSFGQAAVLNIGQKAIQVGILRSH